MGCQCREVCRYLSAGAWVQPGLEIWEEEKEPGQGSLSDIASEHPVLGREHLQCAVRPSTDMLLS